MNNININNMEIIFSDKKTNNPVIFEPRINDKCIKVFYDNDTTIKDLRAPLCKIRNIFEKTNYKPEDLKIVFYGKKVKDDVVVKNFFEKNELSKEDPLSAVFSKKLPV
jgi:hypothetical protein